MPAKKPIDWQSHKAQILAGLDLGREFEALGIDLQGRPGEDGWAPCRAIDREDNSPSAAVNYKTGHYIDRGGVGLSLSFWDLCVALKRFPRWQDARDHYAAVARVTCDGKPPRDPAEHLAFQGWNDALVALWCRHKPGVSPAAVQAAGGRLARYRDQYTVIALPIYGPGLLSAEPTGWVLWNQTGRELPIFQRSKSGQTKTTWKKMKTTGGSDSGLIGRHALDRLTRSDVDPAGQVVWKVEGPSDLLALWALIPPEKRDSHLVLTNAGGATETPKGWMAGLLAGRQVAVVGDADEPGQAGARKWAEWAAKVAAEVRLVGPGQLGFEVAKDHGRDLRDWTAGHTYADLLALVDAAEVVSDRPAETLAVPPDSKPDASGAAPAAASEVPEADDDPHRLARVNLERYATRHDGRTLRYWRDEWYVWKENRYRQITDRELRAKLSLSIKQEFDRLCLAEIAAATNDGKEAVTRKVNTGLVGNVLQATSGMVVVGSDVELGTWLPTRKQQSWVSLRNGIIDVDALLADQDDYLRPNSPEWFSTVSLPYTFDPDATCPKFEAFLEFNQEQDPERIKILQEFAGYCLLPDTGEQKFLILEGEGANGKSVYIAALTAMLGQDNVSNVQLENFGDRFSRTETLGKLLNAAADCGEVDKPAEGYLKSFTSGDRMFFDRKGIAGVNCRPTARLLIACNVRPRFGDRSDGVWRRMKLVPWRIKVPENRRVRGMTDPEWWEESGELPGIFRWALVGLHRLRAQRGFTYSELEAEAIAEYREETNPAKIFLQENLEANRGGKVKSADVYRLYRKWALENGYHPLSERVFGKEVRREFPGVRRVAGGNRKERYRLYEGMVFSQDEICGEETFHSNMF